MAIQAHRRTRRLGNSLPVHRIAVIYCTPKIALAAGREDEKEADSDTFEIGHAIQRLLTDYGRQVDVIDLDPNCIADLKAYDWVFNLTESIYGYPLEEYEIAEQMEKLGIHFTGSGSRALRACIDKAATKFELLCNGIPTPAFAVFQPGEPVINWLDYPLMVKPIHEDGSIGITADSVVWNVAELEAQVQKVHEFYSQAALVEQYIDGRDISASVMGNGAEAEALPLSEIIYPEQASTRFLTFDSKWKPETVEYQESKSRCPCKLEPALEATIKSLALRAYRVMGCQDYARVDFRLKGDLPYVLEVNPNPCISPQESAFTSACKEAGLNYPEMIVNILRVSIRDRMKLSHDTDRWHDDHQNGPYQARGSDSTGPAAG
ncbi:MAG TPA: ATP-grasp domain-containing protein [Longilinea sp.]|nr:ATP-grasp domain-containing protein [Longilinea sp.]